MSEYQIPNISTCFFPEKIKKPCQKFLEDIRYQNEIMEVYLYRPQDMAGCDRYIMRSDYSHCPVAISHHTKFKIAITSS